MGHELPPMAQPNPGLAPTAWRQDTNKHLNKASNMMDNSRTLRSASRTVDNLTRKIQKQEQNHVESALQQKMNKSAGLRTAIHQSLELVLSKMGQVASDKARMDSLINMKRQAHELSVQRYGFRGSRPQREHTSDTVQNMLCKQQAQLQQSIKAVCSCNAEAENLFKKLMNLKSALEHDLQDKSTALNLDAHALSLDGRQGVSLNMPVGGAPTPFREQTWGRRTSSSIEQAKQACLDADRLSRRVVKMEKDLESAENEMMREVQKTLKQKLGETMNAATTLDKKLKDGYKEIETAAKQKDKIVMALDKKQQPMELVQQRYSTRNSSRPGREAVHDEVEVALTTEFSELNSMVRELSKKHKKISTQIKHLNSSAYNLENNLRDKRVAYDVDAQCYRMAAGWRPNQSHPVHPNMTL
eukprot:CAMPEP_0196581354 /NCGR_PEP_ID=MMETSP1081-20130531/33741_1 /TAXON_ID=36882 /ORGANISM="Pyramimonas amylifera, Strain CCMP720" /LENGTH=413 /DNA_ID=CAMNT_0041901557 /DNA_START=134 /DNA_END=1375 /DNA_ORIENTATION=+